MDKKVIAYNLCCERQRLQREKKTINDVNRIKEIDERLNVIENKLKEI